MYLYKRILSYIKPYLHILFAALLCTMLAAAGNLYLPWIFRDMIDKVSFPVRTELSHELGRAACYY